MNVRLGVLMEKEQIAETQAVIESLLLQLRWGIYRIGGKNTWGILIKTKDSEREGKGGFQSGRIEERNNLRQMAY